MSEEVKKKAMDLDGDGKVTLKEAAQYSKTKVKEVKEKVSEKAEDVKENIRPQDRCSKG